MISAQVVETSFSVTNNSLSQDYTHPDDHTEPTYAGAHTYDIDLGFEPLTTHLLFLIPRTKTKSIS